MKKTIALLFLVVALFTGGNVYAHNFWINLTESMTHPPGHVTTQLGFGHSLPVDDLLVGDHGAILIGKYHLVSPDGAAFDLGGIDATPRPPTQSPSKMSVYQGDLGLRKIAIAQDSMAGGYFVTAESVPMFMTRYVDAKGRMKMAPKAIDEIKDAKEVVESFRFKSYSKAFFSVGEWTAPKAAGHALEITPLSDMSNIRVGDLVRFKVEFNGKPVNASAKYIATMTCFSNTFGGPDGFHLSAFVIEGEAQFRMPTSGQWVANVLYQEKVENNPSMKAFQGKCTDVFTSSSVGVTVKP